jgi:hypothetical protein
MNKETKLNNMEKLTKMSNEELLKDFFKAVKRYDEEITELLSRLSKGEKAIEEVKIWKDKFEKGCQNDSEQCPYFGYNENLRCCGNCEIFFTENCPHNGGIDGCSVDSYCDKWQSDNLTRKEREIK